MYRKDFTGKITSELCKIELNNLNPGNWKRNKKIKGFYEETLEVVDVRYFNCLENDKIIGVVIEFPNNSILFGIYELIEAPDIEDEIYDWDMVVSVPIMVDGDYEALDLENYEVNSILFGKVEINHGGDWQEPQDITYITATLAGENFLFYYSKN